MPTIRARAAAKEKRASSFDSEVRRRDGESSSSEHDSISISTASIEKHLKQAQVGLDKFKRQLKALRKENESLKIELASAQESTSQNRHPKTHTNASASEDDMDLEHIQVRDLQEKVQDLQEKVKKLTIGNQRQQKRIDRFKRKELQEEVEDLVQKEDKKPEDAGEMDPEYRMRKLLRKFSDLMLVTTIPDEECPICYEPLELGKCSALECQHILCHDCLPRMSKGADETVECAECRKFSSRDEIELVHMTERDRWDQLLDVAQAWDAWDHRGQEETSEEEAEESFINDETGTSEPSSEGGNENKSADDHPPFDAVSSVRDGGDNPPTPPPCSNRSFSESPTKEKRKRMEQLAEERAHKRRK